MRIVHARARRYETRIPRGPIDTCGGGADYRFRSNRHGHYRFATSRCWLCPHCWNPGGNDRVAGCWLRVVTHVVPAGALSISLLANGPIIYRLPVDSLPLILEVRADGFSGILLLLDSLLAVGILTYSRRAGPRGNGLYAGYLLLVASVYGITLTGGLFSLYLFTTMMVLTAAALVGTTKTAWTSYSEHAAYAWLCRPVYQPTLLSDASDAPDGPRRRDVGDDRCDRHRRRHRPPDGNCLDVARDTPPARARDACRFVTAACSA